MGITVGILGKEGPLPNAYMGVAPGSIGGCAKTGWRCMFQVFKSKADRDAGAQPLPNLGFQVSTQGGNRPGMPGSGNAPAALDGQPAVAPSPEQTDPYPPLYAELMKVYPKALECD